MQEVTLLLAILLGAGFVFAKLGQRVGLPSVTGYILAGLLLGPSGLHLVTVDTIDRQLAHFNQIALMLIAFGIGEHLELRRLRHMTRWVSGIGLAESFGAFSLVALGCYAIGRVRLAQVYGWNPDEVLAMAVLLGAIAVATAPASTLHVMRESEADGPMTTTLMSVVAVDNGLAIMLFGLALAGARNLVGVGQGSPLAAALAGLGDVALSLVMGIATGLLIDMVLRRIMHRGEMLTIGLALLLFCGELARFLDLSPLLAGMAAGFTIVNRDYRDVRLFRALNAFETPIYVLFFILAGAHLDLRVLAVAGWLGLAYFLLRSFGKFAGAVFGARLAGAPKPLQHYLGIALMPQAGVAIGLIVLLGGKAELHEQAGLITQVVLAGVVLAEVAGPVCTRLAMERAGETRAARRGDGGAPRPESEGAVRLVPWTWPRLTPVAEPRAVVLFGASNMKTVGGLARMATLFAHYYQARPLAVRVLGVGERADEAAEERDERALFAAGKTEVRSLGYELATTVVPAADVAAGIVAVARQTRTEAIVLGHPLEGTAQDFLRVVEAVAGQAPCQVIVVRFAGLLHTERILVPLVGMEDLEVVGNTVLALAGVGRHRIKLLRLLPAGVSEEGRQESRQRLLSWAERQGLARVVYCQVVATEARLETIVDKAGRYDLLIMAATQSQGLQRLFFGTLAEEVAQHCKKPLLMVYNPRG